jgi:hypothetical protein
MALARRIAVVDHPLEPAVARPPGLAFAAFDHRHALRPGATYRGQLAACGRTRRRLPGLLLLPGQPGTQGQIPCILVAAACCRGHRTGRPPAVWLGRHSHQAVRAAGGRRRYPPQPHSRSSGPEVLVRPYLGHGSLDCPPSPLGCHRAALARPALRAPETDCLAEQVVWGELPDQPGDGRRTWSNGWRTGCVFWGKGCGLSPMALMPSVPSSSGLWPLGWSWSAACARTRPC